MNICQCGAAAGYPHDPACPRPLYRGSAAALEQWDKEYQANKKAPQVKKDGKANPSR